MMKKGVSILLALALTASAQPPGGGPPPGGGTGGGGGGSCPANLGGATATTCGTATTCKSDGTSAYVNWASITYARLDEN